MRLPNNTCAQRDRKNSTDAQYGGGSDITTNANNGHRSGQEECKSSRSQRQFKLIEGMNGPTVFLPLGLKLGGENINRKISKGENIHNEHLTTKKQILYIGR